VQVNAFAVFATSAIRTGISLALARESLEAGHARAEHMRAGLVGENARAVIGA
jgi:hypothetical protein